MRRDQIGTVGDDRVDIAHHGQAFVQIGNVKPHRLADQLHEIQQLEGHVGLELHEFPMTAVKDRREAQTLPSAAARNSRSRNSALNFGRTERWLACVLTTGTSRVTTSNPSTRAKHPFPTAAMMPGTAARSCNATRLWTGCRNNGRRSSNRLAKNSVIGLMSNGIVPVESSHQRQRDLGDLNLTARAPGDDPRRARAAQPVDRVVRHTAGGLHVALLELLNAAAGGIAAHDFIGNVQCIQDLQHQQRDVRSLDHVAAM